MLIVNCLPYHVKGEQLTQDGMATIWELDFYSRPILDERQKKLWEVLICESPLGPTSPTDSLFRYSQFTSNQEVNSIWLRGAIAEALAQSPQRPEKIRFFRSQMNNMITKACSELAIPASLSRRTYALNRWLQQRMEEVYPTYDGYQPGANPSVRTIDRKSTRLNSSHT